jgi:hypothetical protein
MKNTAVKSRAAAGTLVCLTTRLRLLRILPSIFESGISRVMPYNVLDAIYRAVFEVERTLKMKHPLRKPARLL